MMSKEQEEEKRAYIPPDYSEASKPKLGSEDEEEDIDDIEMEDDDDDLDDDDDFDEEDEEEDPAEEEEKLESASSAPRFQSPSQKPYNNFQQRPTMSTPNWPTPTTSPFGSGNSNSYGQNNNGGWGAPSTPSWGGQKSNSPWGSSSGSSGSQWGNNSGTSYELDRSKQIIFCDVLDCLVISPEANGRLGVIPRGIYDITLRLDVWYQLKRLCPLERIYAMIPRSLILNGSGEDSWKVMLNYIACALAEFLRIPTSACQIITQSFIVQDKADMIRSVLGDVDTEEAVYIGTQSGFLGQSRIDIDAANELGIDYIDLQQFMTIYK